MNATLSLPSRSRNTIRGAHLWGTHAAGVSVSAASRNIFCIGGRRGDRKL